MPLVPIEPTPIRVLSVDDNPVIGEVLRRWFVRDPELTLVAAATSTDVLPDLVASLRPQVVLMDSVIPGEDPFLAVQDLVAHHPGIRVAMFSGTWSREELERAEACGAIGYIAKDEPFEVLALSIRHVVAGERVLSPLAAQESREAD